ncbi:MAG: hypothetical protein J6A16_10610 [Oscillospiraceae bacterium]|nr:hypothetical protein [Oscillospiraceae bacterium]
MTTLAKKEKPVYTLRVGKSGEKFIKVGRTSTGGPETEKTTFHIYTGK